MWDADGAQRIGDQEIHLQNAKFKKYTEQKIRKKRERVRK